MTLDLLKVHLETFLSVPVTQKCQILSCDTLIANKRSVHMTESIVDWKRYQQNLETLLLLYIQRDIISNLFCLYK